MTQPIYISEDAVKRILNWKDTFQAIEVALLSVVKNAAIQNPRTFTVTPNVLLLSMPGCLKDPSFGTLGCKLVTSASKNPTLDPPLPSVNAHIMLFDQTTGIMKAIVAGTGITTWRTSAASAVASKYLTSLKNPEILAILGAGNQGRYHAIAFNNLFNLKEIRIWNRTSSKAEKLVDELNAQFNCKKFVFCVSNRDCVHNADIIATVTYATSPILELEWLKKGAHITAVGAGESHHAELSESIYSASHLYVDNLAGAQSELVGLKKMGVDFRGEVGGVMTGKLPPPSPDQLTVFHGLGMAVEDCAMARFVLDAYQKLGKDKRLFFIG